MRIEDAGNRVVLRTGRAQPCSEKNAHKENENPCNSADYGLPIGLLHRCAHSHQAFSPRTSVDPGFPTAVSVDDRDCLAFEPCNAVSSQLRRKVKPQAALIERFTDD